MKRAKGFTLVELVIVIVIVGILSIVAVPLYRGYTRKSMATEGRALLGTIQTSEKVYFAENGRFFPASNTAFNLELDVDARGNKYFTTFGVSAVTTFGTAATFTAWTSGYGGASGIGLTLFGKATGLASYSATGLNS